MASDSEATCVSDPNFAVICSFLEKFGASCGFTSPDFLELQEMLENTQELSQELIDLHIKLLRKIKRSVSADRWERVLIKLCHTYCSQDAWELERFGYKKARLSSKLRILKMLLEMQFDFNQKFKTEVNSLTPTELRTEPIGKDKHGHSYWFQIDECCQLRVYREDPDEETWVLVANDREGLVRLISQLASDDPSLVADLALNEDSNSLEIEKPILDTGQTSSSTSNCEVDESSKDISSERTDPSPVETSDTTTEEKPEIKPPETEIKPSVITLHKTEPTPEVKKEEVVIEKSVGIDLSIPQPPKGVDLTKRKKSINDLAANLRLKSDIMYKNPVQEQEMDLSVKKPRMDPKQFSSLSEPPFEPISIESALRMSGDFDSEEEEEDDDDEDEEFFDEEDEIELPSHMKPRLDRPTLLGNTKKKTYSDEEDEYGDEIEEPVMYVRGEGSGKDCNNENIFSEVIEEPVMYFFGEGSGRDCETGNEKEEEKNTSQSDSKTGACVDSDSKNETKKIGTVMIDVKSSERTQTDLLSPKKASRWDIGKPDGDSVKDDKKLCDDSTNNSIKDADINKDETDNSCSDISLSDVKTDVNKLSELQKDANTDVENIDCSSPVQKALIDDKECMEKEANKSSLFFFGPGCLQFKQSVASYSPKESKNIDSKLDETKIDKFISESVPTNMNKADTLVDNKEHDTFLQNTSMSSENKSKKLEESTEKQAESKNQDIVVTTTTKSTKTATKETNSTTLDTKSDVQDMQSTKDCEKHGNIERETNKEKLSIDNKDTKSTENVEFIRNNKTHTEAPELKEEIKVVEPKLEETDTNKDPPENILSDQSSSTEQLVDSEINSDINSIENVNKDQLVSDQSSSTVKPVDSETSSEVNNTENENTDMEMSENVTENGEKSTTDIEVSIEQAEKMEIDADETTSKSEFRSECTNDIKMDTTEQNATNIMAQEVRMECSETEIVESSETEVPESLNTKNPMDADSNSYLAQNIISEASVQSEIFTQITTETEIKQLSISNKEAKLNVKSPSTNNEADTETKNEMVQDQLFSSEMQSTAEAEIIDEKSETLSETLESLSTLIETKSDESDDQTKISSTTEEYSKSESQKDIIDEKSTENEIIIEENDSILTTENKTESLDNNDLNKSKCTEDLKVQEEELKVKNEETPVAISKENISESTNTSEVAIPISETINAEIEPVKSETVALVKLNVKDEEMPFKLEENITESSNTSEAPVPDTTNDENESVVSETFKSEEQIVSRTTIEESEITSSEMMEEETELTTENKNKLKKNKPSKDEVSEISSSENKGIFSENSCSKNDEDMLEPTVTKTEKEEETINYETEAENTVGKNFLEQDLKHDSEKAISESKNSGTDQLQSNISDESNKTENIDKEQVISSSSVEENLQKQDFKSESVKPSETVDLEKNISDKSNKTEAENTKNKEAIISSTEQNVQEQDLKSESATTISESRILETDELQENISEESNPTVTETENVENNQTINSNIVDENFQEQNVSSECVTTAEICETESITQSERDQKNVSAESKNTETESIETKPIISSNAVEENSQEQDIKSLTVTKISETELITQSEKLEIDSDTKLFENISEAAVDIEESEQDMDTNIVENISKSVADVQEIIQDIDTKMSTDISESISDIQENVEDVDMTENKEIVSETAEQMDVEVQQEEKNSEISEVLERKDIKENIQSDNVSLSSVTDESKNNSLQGHDTSKNDVITNKNNSDNSTENQQSCLESESRISVNEADDTVGITESKIAPAIQIGEEEMNKTKSKEESKIIENIVHTESKHESPLPSPINVDIKMKSKQENSGIKEVPNIQDIKSKEDKNVDKVTDTLPEIEKIIKTDITINVTESNAEIGESENKFETNAKIIHVVDESSEKNTIESINDDLKMNTDNESCVSNKVIQENVAEKKNISTEMPKNINTECKTELKQPEIVPIIEEKSDISVTDNKTNTVVVNSEIKNQLEIEKTQVTKTTAVEHIEANTAKLQENKVELHEPKITNEETAGKEIQKEKKISEESTNIKSHVPETIPDLKKNCNIADEPIINKTENPVNIVDQKETDKIEVNHVNIQNDAEQLKTDQGIKKNVVDVSDVKNKIADKKIKEKIVQNHDKQHKENDINSEIIPKNTEQLIKPVEITKLTVEISQDNIKIDNIVQEKESVKVVISDAKENLKSDLVFDTIKDNTNTKSNSKSVAIEKEKNNSEITTLNDSSDDDMMDSGAFDQGNECDDSEEEKISEKEIEINEPVKKPKINHAEIKVKGTQNKIILKDINELISDKNKYPEITLCRVTKKEENLVEESNPKVKTDSKVKMPLLTCVDITKLQDTPKPEKKAIVELKQQSYISSTKSLEPIAVDDESCDVIDIPETDPLACTEEDILRSKQEEQSKPPGLSLATFKLDDTETTDTSLIPEPIARALRNRKISIQAATVTPRKRNSIEPAAVTTRKRSAENIADPIVKKRRGRGRRPGNVGLRSIEVDKSSSEEEVEEVQEIKITTPQRGTGKARRGRGRGRGRGGTPVTVEKVANDSPVLSSDPQSETSKTEINSSSAEPKPPKKKRRVLGLDIDPAAIIQPEKKTDSEEPLTRSSIRQSRRIAQQKIKEEAERRKIEELTQVDMPEKKKKKKNDDKDFKAEKKKNKKVSTDSEDSEDEVMEITKKHKKKKKHQDLKKLFNMANPWQSSSESSTSNEEEEEEVEEEPSDEEVPVLKSDHEFSPESDLEDNVEVQPLRRARTVKKESDTEEPTDDQACQKCGKTDHPEWILLCDKCDCGWHCSCLRPALLVIPEGDWFCPPCQHISLVEALKAQLIEYDKKMNRREMEVRRKQRLAYVGISLDNVLPSKDSEAKHEGNQEREMDSDDSSESGSESDSESSSGDESEPIYQLRERRQAHSYRFNDYDELINSAIQDELEAVKGAGNQGRGKDIATIVNAEKEEAKTQALLEQQKLQEQTAPEFEPPPPVVPIYEEKPAQEPEPSEESSDDEQPRVVPKHMGRKKHRKLNSLDISSEDDPDDDEDFKGTSEEEEEDIDDLGSDDSDLDLRRRGKSGPTRRSTRARTKRYDEDFINDDSDDDPPRRKKNRSIWDESESEESDKSWGRRKKYKKQKQFSTPKSSKKSRKKKRRSHQDSDPEVKHPKKPKIKYGGLNDSDDEEFQTRRTRGKKINYIDALGSDSDEERQKKVKPIESEEEYVANEEEEDAEEVMDVVEDEEKDSESDSVENKVISRKIIKIIAPSKVLKGRGKAGIPRPQHLKVTPPPPPGIPEQEPEPESEPMDEDPEDMEEEDDEDEESEEPQVPVDIPVIAANPDDLNEEEVGMMMENEEYAKKQLELMAIQLAKEKKKKEKEAKKLAEKKELVVPPVVIPTATVITPPDGPKKRGRKKKSEIEAMKAAAAAAAAAQESITTVNPAGKLSPLPPTDIPATVSDLSNSPPKRRGRGKGKKTLAAEAAAAVTVPGATPHPQQETITATTVIPPISVPPNVNIPTAMQNEPQSLSPNMHVGKLGIAAPPQPFSQNQPTPSVITRMLQSQPISAQNLNQKYYSPGMPPEQPPRSSPSGQYSPIGRGRVPSPYRQSPPAMGMYPGVRPMAPNSPHRLRSPGPPNMQMFHSTHHSMDPSPSGGGPINIAPNNRDRNSPGNVGSPMTSKEGPTPPPPPYSRTVNRYSPNENSPGPSLPPPLRHHLFGQGAAHLQQPSPPPRPPPGNFSPYHPPPPPNYHYGAYPPPPALAAADDALPPTDYQGSPYPEHYNTAEGTVHSSEGSNSKPFDEEGSGEFGGLVSYFSSQREDDLDT